MRKPNPSPLVIAAGASLLVSLIWVGLSLRTPASTFHFAPLIAGAVGPYAAKSAAGRVPTPLAIQAAAAGVAMVILAILLLVATDRMQGPTFWSAQGAALEALLFTAAGGLGGFALLFQPRFAAE